MEKLKRLYVLMGLITLLSLVVVSPVMAKDAVSVESLRGLKELAVLVEAINPEIEKEGLTGSIIQTDVELKFRLAGIKVITTEESIKVPGNPWLYVNVTPVEHNSRGYIYSIFIDFHQDAILIRNSMEISGVSTWYTGMIGFAPGSSSDAFQEIRGHIKDQVDIFINDYLSVNPK